MDVKLKLENGVVDEFYCDAILRDVKTESYIFFVYRYGNNRSYAIDDVDYFVATN